jgi:tetratricopeptide (TPR) repeat protein
VAPTSLDRLAEAVADGRAVDWTDLEASCTSDEEREQIRNLRTIASLRDVHGGTPRPSNGSRSDRGEPTTDVDIPLPAWGGLKLGRLLGRGGFGEVYLARDERLDRPVALKLLRDDLSLVPGLEDRILAEARILASVRHPNVVTVHGADVHDGRAAFWMEYVEGQTLEDSVIDGPLGPGEAALVGLDVCHALAAVHRAGIIHRDVKARNIMRDRSGRILLMDFGAGLTPEAQLASVRGLVGTPVYLAPELLEGARASVASDLYATGVLLFHLLTRRYPHEGESVEALAESHRAGRQHQLVDLRPDVPTALVDVVERALHPDPRERFRSAGEMASALSETLGRTEDGSASGWLSRRGLLAATGTLLMCVAAGTVIMNLVQRYWIAEPALRAIAVPQLSVEPGTAIDASLPPGLTHDIVRELQRRGVLVRGGASAADLAGFSFPEFRSRLNVDAVLQGTIGSTGGHLRVTASLRRTSDDQAIWSRYFAPTTAELPDLGATIAGDVARAIGRPEESRPRALIAYPAYEQYLRARFLAERRTPESLALAIDAYKRSIANDPTYAQPWVGLADAYIALGIPTFGALRPLDSRRMAKEAVMKALELDPESAEAHCTLGFIWYFQDWSWLQAEHEFRRGLALNPEYAQGHDWYGDFLNAMGRFPEAFQQIERARDIEPLSVLIHRDVAWQLFFQRRYDDAVRQLRETLTMDPSFGAAHSLLGRVLAEQGQYEEALEHLSKANLPRPTHLAFAAQVEAAAGRRTLAEQHLKEAIALGRNGYLSAYHVALVVNALGRPDEAIQWLERSYDQQDFTLVNVYTDPRFADLRRQPRLQALIDRMAFPRQR